MTHFPRWSAVVLAVLFAACGGAAPTTTPATATTGGDPAVELLMTLIVADADPQLEYDRGDWGSGWSVDCDCACADVGDHGVGFVAHAGG
ncbi:MAG: hypothetical protein OSB37_01790 [Acidimicrobiales bacterium]|nr:hypothetical protein [Acidimicrobiales bacterium]